MAATGKRILLIEDDREISTTIQSVLDAAGYTVVAAPNGVEGQKLVSSEEPQLVITDMMMPRMGGFPVLEFLSTLENPPRVIMITANEGARHKAYAETATPGKVAVDEYLRKPFPMDVLLEAVERLIGPPDGAASKGDSDKGDEEKAKPKASERMRRGRRSS
ncbi:response regulator [Thalassoroseus pseudoceratinae]|uniref:response regulator n=1 Tax=Thalassoroseus pseudoceratinae TaxID=2713176 RepID=UPI00141F6CE2|nr:response regulator [Thalassoroseus pseudoceratinae]